MYNFNRVNLKHVCPFTVYSNIPYYVTNNSSLQLSVSYNITAFINNIAVHLVSIIPLYPSIPSTNSNVTITS